MAQNIEKIAPTEDLAEYLEKVRDSYNAKGLGIQLKDVNELCMIMEKDLVKAGIIPARTYKNVVDRDSLIPDITRDEDHTPFLEYMILKIKPKKKNAAELLCDHAKGVIKLMADAGAIDFGGAAFEKDGDLYIVSAIVDEDGNRFTDDIIDKMDAIV